MHLICPTCLRNISLFILIPEFWSAYKLWFYEIWTQVVDFEVGFCTHLRLFSESILKRDDWKHCTLRENYPAIFSKG